ncbi:LOW QUALITY PROTEIN: hypothetical protein NC651_010017 [Populus alba x Populus x berolinensis]|nr:LOW QUALITY PROTEIN: hypothetical protein NC651_010017 [Populus alba x Populus x berolinensis]
MPSPEASSSLSSEVEGLEEGVQEDDVGDLSHGEEIAVASEEKESAVRKVALDVDDGEDVICKRTRARYSLATLDELETFLQESDDEDDLPNVDDEVECRKFLAAVLLGGDVMSNQESENVDDEDEDFEIELEELLDSDVDDGARDEGQGLKNERGGRRPETRQKTASRE